MEALLADLSRYGVPLVGFNVFLQQLGVPIPAVPTMMVAGALAADGRISGMGVFAISVAASVVADALWFWAGRRYGYPVLRFLCRISLSPDTCVRQTEGIFERWGFYSVVVSKFVPGFSTVAPPIAGALRMRFGHFLLAVVASAVLWVGAAMGVGLAFSAQIEAVLAWIAANVQLAVIAVLVLLAAYVSWKAVQRWRIARHVEGALIDADELAHELAGELKPLVVDLGSRLAHQSRPHIPDALLMDLDEVAGYDFPRDRAIVFYCSCPNEWSSKHATQILLMRGYTDVRPLVGGIDEWIARGHPVATPLVEAGEPQEVREVA
jgi:membrane protein DedA with SNARE-associated domain/rhodanese-related sulfurtransferase